MRADKEAGTGRRRQESGCLCDGTVKCRAATRRSRRPPRFICWFRRPAPPCLPPAARPAARVHYVHSTPRVHRQPPAPIRRQACAGPADRQRAARWAGAGRAPRWPCSGQPRRGVTCGCWGAMGAIGRPCGGSWAALIVGSGCMSVEMAVESPTDMLVRNLGGHRT